MPPQNSNRTLTDADVQALASALRVMVVQEFYKDLGKGVWSFAWKAIVLALIGLAAYGSSKHI